jgi:hypothetical protein
MNYFDSDKTKSTNTVAYFDWQTNIKWLKMCFFLNEMTFISDLSSKGEAPEDERWLRNALEF